MPAVESALAWPNRFGWLQVARATVEAAPSAARRVEAGVPDGRRLGALEADLRRALGGRAGGVTVTVRAEAPYESRETWASQLGAAACWAALACLGVLGAPPAGTLVTGGVGPGGALVAYPAHARAISRAGLEPGVSPETDASIWDAAARTSAGAAGKETEVEDSSVVTVELNQAQLKSLRWLVGLAGSLERRSGEGEDPTLGERIKARALADMLLPALEAAANRENPGWTPVQVCGSNAVLYNPGNAETPYVAVFGYDPETNGWSHGSYKQTLLEAYGSANRSYLLDLDAPDVVSWAVFTTEDVKELLLDRCPEQDADALAGEVARDIDVEDVRDRMVAAGWDALGDEVDEALENIESLDGMFADEEVREASLVAPALEAAPSLEKTVSMARAAAGAAARGASKGL